MKYSKYIIMFIIVFYSCIEPVIRRPKSHSTTNFYKEIIKKNKKLNDIEKRFLEKLIKKDTSKNYLSSSSGFWYFYVKKDSINNTLPKPLDLVTLQYSISDIYNKILYPNVDRTYKVDKEDLIPALQDGIKLMKKGEVVTFLIPSYRAFGVSGDGNKIGINQPIKITVTLININKNKK